MIPHLVIGLLSPLSGCEISGKLILDYPMSHVAAPGEGEPAVLDADGPHNS
jgi:hypothetical protein